MDMNEFFTLLGNYVFPIVMCVMVWIRSTQSMDKIIDKVTKLIQANTEAMTANANALEDLRQTIDRRMS